MTNRWERLTDLYHVAVALPPDERALLLTEACADDPALQADVERLVAAHERASRAANAPTDAAPVASTAAEGTDREPPPPVDRLGPYRMPRDVGPRAADQVMGEPIDAYADARHLSIPERLQLFVQVCNAVAASHRRGVIHGDVTPANIVVTASGTPKLLDVGTADLGATAADDIHALGIVLDGLLGGTAGGRRRRLREDLETIVLTARGQAVGQRYETVEALAADIRRYLDSPSARTRPDNARAHPGTTSRSRSRAILAWAVAGVAIVALGVKTAELVVRPAPAVAVTPPAEIPDARERVFVPDLADHVGDARLVAALSDALRSGLAESPNVEIVSGRRRGVSAEVTASIVAAPTGIVITAQFARVDAAYRPEPLRETATDSTDLMPALGRIAERLRGQWREAPSSIAATPRLEEVTSASLPALRAYAGGSRAIAAGDRAGGVRLLETAVRLDTGFAAAHRLLATTYADLGDRRRSAEALDHALANLTRLPYHERHLTVATHAMTVLANYATAIDAYNLVLQRYPDDVRALSGLAFAHAARREYAVQESLLVRALAVDSSVPSLYTTWPSLERTRASTMTRAACWTERSVGSPACAPISSRPSRSRRRSRTGLRPSARRGRDWPRRRPIR